VELLYPASPASDPVDISDSTFVYVKAKDNAQVARVEIWSGAENAEEPTRIADLTAPLSNDQIPEEYRPVDGSAVYGTRWSTRTIPNFTRVRVFAYVFDPAGNSTRSEVAIVRILNAAGDLNPPRPQIIIEPPSGQVGVIFTFDASQTEDDDPNATIFVRWDWDGDGEWDADSISVNTPVQHTFSRPGIYRVKLDAWNDYLPNRVGSVERQLEVTAVGGDPNPPEPQNMITIPAGIYRVGAGNPNDPFANEDERPVHRTRLTSTFKIERTEVTNALYLDYLEVAMGGDTPLVRREGNFLRFYRDLVEPVEEDSLPVVILDLTRSAIFYDPDQDAMAVAVADRLLPVVGVTWFGATAYAESYGLRLPTEHEWEIAAKADSVLFTYPWGTTITPEQANYSDASRPRRLLPIGSFPQWPTPFGLLDVVGNAKEWMKDWYGDYPVPQNQNDVFTNPEGPLFGTLRVIRGGGFLSTPSGVRVTAREAADPEIASEQIGFRTAYTVTSTP
jgi:formylglycine-generating enzyme required for sulfatase activity